MSDLVPDSLYSILGISRTASVQDIRSAYKKIALSAHPDKGGSKERFQRVVHAFEVLSSAREREKYDRRFEESATTRSNRTAKKQHQNVKATERCTTAKASAQQEDPPVRIQRTDRSRDWASKCVPGCRMAASSSNVEQKGQSELHSKQAEHARLAQLREASHVALTTLQAAIACIPKDRRRLVLESLSMPVRTALLDHMSGSSSKQSEPPGSKCASSIVLSADQDEDSSTSSSELGSLSDASSSNIEDQLCLEDDVSALDQVSETLHTFQPSGETFNERQAEHVDVKSLDDAQQAKPPIRMGRQPLSGIKGVLRVNMRLGSAGAYRANVVVQNFGIVSDILPSLSRAIEVHALLVQVKQQIVESDQTRSFECRLHEALESVCQEHKFTSDVLGNAFSAIVSCYSLIGGNIKTRYTQEMDAALDARRRLLQGKAEGWPRLREEWIRLLQLPVKASKLVGRGLQAPSTLEEATQRVDAAWDRYTPRRVAVASWQRMLMEKQEQRKLGSIPKRPKIISEHLSSEEQERLRQLRYEARMQREQRRLERQLRRERRCIIRAEKRVQVALRHIERFQNAMRRNAALEESRLKALQAEEARIIERKRREKWNWQRDPSRTLEEIMHGPA